MHANTHINTTANTLTTIVSPSLHQSYTQLTNPNPNTMQEEAFAGNKFHKNDELAQSITSLLERLHTMVGEQAAGATSSQVEICGEKHNQISQVEEALLVFKTRRQGFLEDDAPTLTQTLTLTQSPI